MIDNATIDLIGKTVDGASTPSEEIALAEIVKRDPFVAAELAEMRQLSSLLASVQPLSPPARLIESVLAMTQVKENAANGNEQRDQLLRSSTVIGTYDSNSGYKERSRISFGGLFQSIQSFVEVIMSKENNGLFSGVMGKALIGGGVAAAALIAGRRRPWQSTG